jgi:predicted dienelactone hydrolase
MNAYNPFQRGPHPVGTRQFEWTDTNRGSSMPVDVWYPATSEYQGQDLDPDIQDKFEVVPGLGASSQSAVKDARAKPEARPLIIFSHGFGGERRQSTFFYCHLASHGYVVAAMDHVGNTTANLISGDAAASDPDVTQRFIDSRPADASFVIDQMLAGKSGLQLIADQVGMSGHSFGGWTTLKTLETDHRIKAALPLAPAGGGTAIDPDNAMAKSLNFNWQRPVPVLYLVADLDSILPLEGMQDLHDRNPEPKTTVVLANADHFHFNDNIAQSHDGFKMIMQGLATTMDDQERNPLQEMLAKMKPSSELVPAEHAYDLINGLGLAHFDAELKGIEEASYFLSSNLAVTLADRSIAISMLSTQEIHH